ncbi:MAG: 50S ribosomal protein L5 [Candidatus Gottesmanbacteria bacterium]
MENIMMKPKLIKIVINISLKEALVDKKKLEIMAGQLALITGQKPVTTYARKAIAAFKLRQGDPLGLKVTLRGSRMHDFFKKMVTIVLSRVRDFKGVSLTGFDGRGNYTLGIGEILIFPEIDFTKIDKQSLMLDKSKGLEVTIVTTAGDNNQGKKLLEEMGMPFSHQ